MTVQNNPTIVAHTPGARTLSLTHVGNAYAGTIDSTAQFATAPHTITAGASQYTLTISGHFIVSGFDATVHVGVRQPSAPQTCSYLVHWVGVKDGRPNVLEGHR